MRRRRGESVRRGTEGSRDVILQSVDGNDAAIYLFIFFISFKLHEYSAALEDVRGGFVSRRACKYLHLLAVVVTGLWGIL